MPKVKIERDLYDKIERYAETIGYSSTQEFVIHILEREVGRLEDADSREELIKKLQGLGYI